MSVHLHVLAGCAPSPLAHYLKALGVLRLVAGQEDRAARGFWRHDQFHLATRLSEAELLDFFLHRYKPTPLVAPWNGGSGFYPKDNKGGIDAIMSGGAVRLEPYRGAIARAREAVGKRTESPKQEEKLALIRELRARWDGGELEWLDAALVLAGGDDGIDYPALLGTGGNDGRLDFTNNQMQRLMELMDPETGRGRPHAEPLLDQALFGRQIPGLQQDKAIGQFLPGGAGGANSTAGFEGKSLLNPWDFVLALEGALVLRVAAVRRLDGHGLPQASAPFAVRGRASGYASAASADESSRGEQWMPLWSGPATQSEVEALFAEGRLQSGTHRAQSALGAALAVARLGAARGVTAFERYGYIERNGQSNLAVPLGRWRVRVPRPGEAPGHVHLLEPLEPWVERLRSSGTPALEKAARRIEDAMLAICRSEDPVRWQDLLIRLGEAEDAIARRRKLAVDKNLRPLPRLSGQWLTAAWQDRAEFLLAAAIASQEAPGDKQRSLEQRLGPIRVHCLPLDPERAWRDFRSTSKELVADPAVVWRGRELSADLAAIVQRRVMEAARVGTHAFPLAGRPYARLADVRAFLLGQTDDGRLSGLVRGLMALDWEEAPTPRPATEPAPPLPAPYALMRLAHLPDIPPLRTFPVAPRLDSSLVRLLLAGRLPEAVRLALARLSNAGLRPRLRFAFGGPASALRIAASLAIPLSRRDLERLRHQVLMSQEFTAGEVLPQDMDSPAETLTAAPEEI
ncbi:MAG: type I-U CRISPR-associated protein Csx17 [Myxococcaceae bacterium]|nr:type I-U CRISPR-associated protein Csx17 [Myxococcaceae bacterium]